MSAIRRRTACQPRFIKNWPKGVYSIVSFKIEKEGAGTRLIFDHTGVPEKDVDHLAEGWKKMYCARISEYFG